MSHYDLQSILKDRNGNKRNHFLFFVLSLVLIGKPWYIQMGDVLNVYVIACIFDIALFYHVMLICDTKIKIKKKKIK